MPKFNVAGEFSLRTEIEPYNVRFDTEDIPAEEHSDVSYFRSYDVTCEGGEFKLAGVVAEDEEAVEALVNESIFDGQEIEDMSGITWLVDDLTLTIDQTEDDEMTRERAIEVLAAFLAAEVASGRIPAEAAEALKFLLTDAGVTL